jgi:hypothetical protein
MFASSSRHSTILALLAAALLALVLLAPVSADNQIPEVFMHGVMSPASPECLPILESTVRTLTGAPALRVVKIANGSWVGYIATTAAGKISLGSPGRPCIKNRTDIIYKWLNHAKPLTMNFPGSTISQIYMIAIGDRAIATVRDSRGKVLHTVFPSIPINVGASVGVRVEDPLIMFPKDSFHREVISFALVWIAFGVEDSAGGPVLLKRYLPW